MTSKREVFARDQKEEGPVKIRPGSDRNSSQVGDSGG